jgi:hypothetical protein
MTLARRKLDGRASRLACARWPRRVRMRREAVKTKAARWVEISERLWASYAARR